MSQCKQLENTAGEIRSWEKMQWVRNLVQPWANHWVYVSFSRSANSHCPTSYCFGDGEMIMDTKNGRCGIISMGSSPVLKSMYVLPFLILTWNRLGNSYLCDKNINIGTNAELLRDKLLWQLSYNMWLDNSPWNSYPFSVIILHVAVF